MIERYSDKTIQNIFVFKNKLKHFVFLQKLVCTYYLNKLNNQKDSLDLSYFDKIDYKKLEQDSIEFEKTTKHETIAMLYALLEQIPDSLAKYAHMGLTSSDFLDTILTLQLFECTDYMNGLLLEFKNELKKVSLNHKDSKMLGRTHGMAGEIITFGFVMLNFYEECNRCIQRLQNSTQNCLKIKINGSMGNYAHIDLDLEQFISDSLNIKSANITTQVIQRDNYSEYMFSYILIGSFVERFATEIRNLSKSGIEEVSEGLSKGQGGSSSMPHKVNPILSENICGLSRIIRSYINPIVENNNLWNQRDMTHSSVERVVYEDCITLCCFIVKRAINIIKNLNVNLNNMEYNIKREKGKILSQSILIKLLQKGLTRENAYKLIQQIVIEKNEIDKKDLEVIKELNEKDIEDIFHFSNFTKNIDLIYKRILIE